MRTYRPVPVTLRVWVPPVPVVVEKMVVQVELSVEVWIWNALPYAASHCSTTWQTACAEPRSTSSHCGSENARDRRLRGFQRARPEAGGRASRVEDAVAVWFSGVSRRPRVPP